MTAPDRLLSTGDVARLWNVSVKTVNRWARKGQLPSVRSPGGHFRFRESVVHESLRQQREEHAQ